MREIVSSSRTTERVIDGSLDWVSLGRMVRELSIQKAVRRAVASGEVDQSQTLAATRSFEWPGNNR